MEALRLMTGTPTRNYEEIDRLLSCPICLEVFTKPVVILPCQHNLCRKCANDVFQQRGTPMGSGGRFRCPTCRYEVILDRHGVYGLQRNLLVENIIDMYQQEGRKPNFMKVEQSLMCEDHEEEKVNIYCLTCQKPTCSLCKVFGQHQECEVSPMDQVYKEQKKEISDAIALLVTGNDRLQSIITQTEELGKMAESNGRQVKTDLCEAFDKLYAVLEERKTSMLAKITADTQERSQVLQEMLKNYGQQLEGASKLMEASLSLLEERSIPQFLSMSRDMIEKVICTARSSDVRKPPYNIQHMDEFHVNFGAHESLLYQLDFSLPEEVDAKINLQKSGETGDIESEVDEECDANAENGANDSDDATNTSVTSRSDVGGNTTAPVSFDNTGPSHSRDHVATKQTSTSPVLSANSENEAKKSSVEEPTPEIKKGRWYDMFVRQLPSPISMNPFPSPMESSVHMKVIIPPSNEDEGDDLKKDDVAPESVSSMDSEERDREIEQLLARPRRRTWISRLSLQSSADDPLDVSPKTSPTCLSRFNYALGTTSPTLSSPRTSPVMFQRHQWLRDVSPASTTQSSPRSSPLLRQKHHHHRMQNSSPSNTRHRHLGSDTPSKRDAVSSLRRPSDAKSARCDSPTTSVQQGVSNSTNEEASSNQLPRRPKVYFTHKRRTWSHLLDKK